ncbi:MAG: hypothetical protein K8I65_01155 [Thermoanaerobaculia bacterium]|nr:hypothetical protein [Thermoanaerobaculia bacterium]
MPIRSSNRWRQGAWYAAVAVIVLVAWHVAVRLVEVARKRWANRGPR